MAIVRRYDMLTIVVIIIIISGLRRDMKIFKLFCEYWSKIYQGSCTVQSGRLK